MHDKKIDKKIPPLILCFTYLFTPPSQGLPGTGPYPGYSTPSTCTFRKSLKALTVSSKSKPGIECHNMTLSSLNYEEVWMKSQGNRDENKLIRQRCTHYQNISRAQGKSTPWRCPSITGLGNKVQNGSHAREEATQRQHLSNTVIITAQEQ